MTTYITFLDCVYLKSGYTYEFYVYIAISADIFIIGEKLEIVKLSRILILKFYFYKGFENFGCICQKSFDYRTKVTLQLNLLVLSDTAVFIEIRFIKMFIFITFYSKLKISVR